MQPAPQSAHAELAAAGFRFGGCELHLETRQLVQDGGARPIEPKTFEVLVYLIERRHRVVPKRELHEALWQGRAVCEGALSQCIWTARKAIGDGGHRQGFIKTLNGVGYRFVGPVEVIARSAESGSVWLLDAAIARLELARALLRSPSPNDHLTARGLARVSRADAEILSLPWLGEEAQSIESGSPAPRPVGMPFSRSSRGGPGGAGQREALR